MGLSETSAQELTNRIIRAQLVADNSSMSESMSKS